MELLLKRVYTCSTYTIGHLYEVCDDGVLDYICDTLEDADRYLDSSMSLSEIKNKKIYCETAIPTGTYIVDMNTKSPKYSNFKRYSWARKYNGYLPRLVDVKGFSGVLMHVGNNNSHTCGCILIGMNKKKGAIVDSVKTFNMFMETFMLDAKDNDEEITLTIKRTY